MSDAEELTKDFMSELSRMHADDFLALARNYLGALPSPFNKRLLVEKMTFFFGQKKIQDAIERLLDQEDRLFLSAIVFYHTKSENDLKAFLGSRSSREIRVKLRNFRERLLLIYDEKTGRYRFNPLFEPLKSAWGITKATPFAAKRRTREPSVFRYGDILLNALLAAKSRDARGELEKKEALTRSLSGLGLLDKSDEPNMAGLKALAALPLRARAAYLAAGYAGSESDDKTALASAIYALLSAYVDFAPDEALVGRFYHVACGGELSESATSRLVEFGICERAGGSLLFASIEESESLAGCVAAESDLSVLFFPSAPFAPILAVALEWEKVDTGSLFKLTADGAARAFHLKLTPADIMGELERLTGSALPGAIAVNLEHWYSSHLSVCLYEGRVLRLSTEREAFAQASGLLDKISEEKIAQGVYLVKERATASDLAALRGGKGRVLATVAARSDAGGSTNFDIPPQAPAPMETLDAPVVATIDPEDRLAVRKVTLIERVGPLEPDKIHVTSGFDIAAKRRALQSAIECDDAVEITTVNEEEIVTCHLIPISLTGDELTAVHERSGKPDLFAIRKIASVKIIPAALVSAR